MANITKTKDIIKICDEKQVVYENRFMKNKQTWSSIIVINILNY